MRRSIDAHIGSLVLSRGKRASSVRLVLSDDLHVKERLSASPAFPPYESPYPLACIFPNHRRSLHLREMSMFADDDIFDEIPVDHHSCKLLGPTALVSFMRLLKRILLNS
jgi:hypothetical protein